MCPVHPAGLGGGVVKLGVKSDLRAVWVFVRAQELSLKKTLRASEQDWADVARKRQRWQRHQAKVDPRRLVFLDETWVKTNLAPLRGWGPRGQRLDAQTSHGHWRALTFIAALRHDRVSAPWVVDGPTNGAIFRRYVETVLVPVLNRATSSSWTISEATDPPSASRTPLIRSC